MFMIKKAAGTGNWTYHGMYFETLIIFADYYNLT